MESQRGEHKEIELKTKKDLAVYMNPTRQKILRILLLAEEPLTAKDLSRRLEVSASSAQYHLKLLLGLGLVAVHHTAVINGITATYYMDGDATIRIGMDHEGLNSEKEALALSLLQDVWQGFTAALRDCWQRGTPPQRMNEHGEIRSGIAYLSPEEWGELQGIMSRYLGEHEQPRPGTTPWEYALLAYDTRPVREEEDAHESQL